MMYEIESVLRVEPDEKPQLEECMWTVVIALVLWSYLSVMFFFDSKN